MATLSGGNYGSVGQQINKQNQSLNNINMESSPDYGKIAEEAIKGRSRERRAAIEAEARINKVGLDAMGTKKLYQIKADSDKEVADIKRPAKRFAGIVGAAGTIAGGFVMKKFNDEAKTREEKWEKRLEERMRLTEEALSRPTPKPPEIEKPPTMPNIDFEDPNGGTTSSGSGGGATTGSGSEVASAPVSAQKMYSFMTQDLGLSHTHSVGLLANIRRESNFQTNVWGDNGTSNGLFQWHKGRLSRMQAAVPDWQTNWQGQIRYALEEQGEPGQQYLSTNFQNEGEAAAFWTRRWERPADPDGGIAFQNNWISSNTFQ